MQDKKSDIGQIIPEESLPLLDNNILPSIICQPRKGGEGVGLICSSQAGTIGQIIPEDSLPLLDDGTPPSIICQPRKGGAQGVIATEAVRLFINS